MSEAGERLQFDREGIAHCERSRKTYLLADGRVTEISGARF
jgi:hypothetical protein